MPNFSGQPRPFRYRLDGARRYELWPVGANGLDDRGNNRPTEDSNGRLLDELFDGPEIPKS